MLDTMPALNISDDFENNNIVALSDSESNLNIVEYLVKKIVLVNLSNLNLEIRALSVQILGLTSIINYHCAESYIELLFKVNL